LSLVEDIHPIFHVLDWARKKESRIKVDGVVVVNIERGASYNGDLLQRIIIELGDLV
jgi:hypothetical protein